MEIKIISIYVHRLPTHTEKRTTNNWKRIFGDTNSPNNKPKLKRETLFLCCNTPILRILQEKKNIYCDWHALFRCTYQPVDLTISIQRQIIRNLFVCFLYQSGKGSQMIFFFNFYFLFFSKFHMLFARTFSWAKSLVIYLFPIALNHFLAINAEFRFKYQSFAGSNQYRAGRHVRLIIWIEGDGCDFMVSKSLNFLRFIATTMQV